MITWGGIIESTPLHSTFREGKVDKHRRAIKSRVL